MALNNLETALFIVSTSYFKIYFFYSSLQDLYFITLDFHRNEALEVIAVTATYSPRISFGPGSNPMTRGLHIHIYYYLVTRTVLFSLLCAICRLPHRQ